MSNWLWDNMETTRVAGNGNLGLSIYPFGELNAEERRDDIAVLFHYPFYNVDFDMQPAVIVGGATATVADGYLELSSGVGESVTTPSKQSIRYIGGHSGFAQFTASFAGAGVGTIGAWAADEDGFFIRVNNGVPQIGYARNGTETVASPTGRFFHGGTIPLDLIDFTKINIFRILFGYLGVANPVYEIKVLGRWFVLGTFQTEGRMNNTHVANPVLPITMRAEGDMTMRTASWNGGRVGGEESAGARGFPTNQSRAIVGTALGTVSTFRNKEIYQTKTNRVKVRLVRYSFFVDGPATGSGTVEFKIIKNAILAGIPSWTDVDTDNSVLEFDTTATYDSGGRETLIAHVGYASGGGASADVGGVTDQNANDFELFLLPGETETITAQNVSGSTDVTVRVVLNQRELF